MEYIRNNGRTTSAATENTLNTQMTPEAMMQERIERLKRTMELDRKFAKKTANDVVIWKRRAEKAERELAEHRAQTEALIAAAIERDGGTHDEDCKAMLDREPCICTCGRDELMAAIRAYRDSNQAEGVR